MEHVWILPANSENQDLSEHDSTAASIQETENGSKRAQNYLKIKALKERKSIERKKVKDY